MPEATQVDPKVAHVPPVDPAPATASPLADVKVMLPGRQGSLRKTFRDAWDFRLYIGYQTRRELKTQYSRSFLGWIWSVINPLTNLLIYSLVFGTILAGNRALPPNPDGLNSYAHFLFSALVFWTLFSAMSNSAINQFTSTVSLRKRMYFPSVCPSIARTLVLLVGSAIEILVMVAAYMVVGSVSVTFVELVPIALLLTLFSFGVGLTLSVANARWRDVGYLYGVFLRLFFYLTPVIYPIRAVPENWAGVPLRELVQYSPLTIFVTAARRVTYEERWVQSHIWLQMAGCAVVMFLIGWALFHRYADDMAEGVR